MHPHEEPLEQPKGKGKKKKTEQRASCVAAEHACKPIVLQPRLGQTPKSLLGLSCIHLLIV